QNVHPGEAVAHHDDGADGFHFDVAVKPFDLSVQNGADLVRSNRHSFSPRPYQLSCARLRLSPNISRRVRTLPSMTRSPMRATTPPRSASSCLVKRRILRPVISENLRINASAWDSVRGA